MSLGILGLVPWETDSETEVCKQEVHWALLWNITWKRVREHRWAERDAQLRSSDATENLANLKGTLQLGWSLRVIPNWFKGPGLSATASVSQWIWAGPGQERQRSVTEGFLEKNISDPSAAGTPNSWETACSVFKGSFYSLQSIH